MDSKLPTATFFSSMASSSQTIKTEPTRESPLSIDRLLNPHPLTSIASPARLEATKSGRSKDKRSRADANFPSERLLDWHETDEKYLLPHVTSPKNKRRRKGDIIRTAAASGNNLNDPASTSQGLSAKSSTIVVHDNQHPTVAQVFKDYGTGQLADDTKASWYADAVYDEKTGNFKLPNGRLLVIPQNHYGRYPDEDCTDNEWTGFGWEQWTPNNEDRLPDDRNELLAYEREAYNCLTDMSAIAPFETAANNMAKSAGYFIQGNLYTAQNIKNAAKRAVGAMLKVHRSGCTEGPYVDISFDKSTKKHVTKREATKRMLKLYDNNAMALVDDAEAEVRSYHLMSFRERFAVWCEVVKIDKKVVVDLLNGEIEPVKLVVAPELLTEKKAGYRSTNRGRAEVLAIGQAVKKQTSGPLNNTDAPPPVDTGGSDVYFSSLKGHSEAVPIPQYPELQATVVSSKMKAVGRRRSTHSRKKKILPPSVIQPTGDPGVSTQPTSLMTPYHSQKASNYWVNYEHHVMPSADTQLSTERSTREFMNFTGIPDDMVSNSLDPTFDELSRPISGILHPSNSVVHPEVNDTEAMLQFGSSNPILSGFTLDTPHGQQISLPSIDQWYLPDSTLPINEPHLTSGSQEAQEGYINHSAFASTPTMFNGVETYASLQTGAGATTHGSEPSPPMAIVQDHPVYLVQGYDLPALDDSALEVSTEGGHVDWYTDRDDNDYGHLGGRENTQRDMINSLGDGNGAGLDHAAFVPDLDETYSIFGGNATN